MKINYTYKFLLKPTKEQVVLIEKHIGVSRWIYNYFLNLRKTRYVQNNENLNYNQMANMLPSLKDELPWLREVNAQTQQYVVRNLDTAFQNFFRKISRYPKFKKKTSCGSFPIPQHVSIKNGKVCFPKFSKGIKFVQHREIEGRIIRASISRNVAGQYFISILVEREIEHLNKTKKVVGIDLGVKTLVVCSDGTNYQNPHILKKHSLKLAKLQRYLARKTKKDSKRRLKNKQKIARLHVKISNTRLDYIHKLTKKLVSEYDIIAGEKLSSKQMLHESNHRLARGIQDASFYEIVHQLEYKSKWYGKKFVQIEQFFPSSKTCFYCGYENNNLTLNDRDWTCPVCHKKLDRDFNASLNILREGLRLLDYRQELSITPEEILKVQNIPETIVSGLSTSLSTNQEAMYL